MDAIIFLTLTAAQTQQNTIDAVYGWPKVGEGVCQRVRVGGGRHVDHPLCCTVHKAEFIKHPTLNQWAVFVPQDVKDLLGLVTVKLDSTWERGL